MSQCLRNRVKSSYCGIKAIIGYLPLNSLRHTIALFTREEINSSKCCIFSKALYLQISKGKYCGMSLSLSLELVASKSVEINVVSLVFSSDY